MSPIRERDLGRDPRESALILVDQACPECGYNLKGLRNGAPCPECGKLVRSVDPRRGDSLADAPAAYLRAQSAAGVLLAILYPICAVLTTVAAAISASDSIDARFRAGVAIVAFVVASLWILPVVLATTPRRSVVRAYHEEHRLLRTLARLSQGLWALAAILAVLRALDLSGGYTSTLDEGVKLAMTLSSTGAFFGLAALAIILSATCDWAFETGVAGMLRSVAWVIVVLGGFGLLGALSAAFFNATGGAFGASLFGMIAFVAQLSSFAAFLSLLVLGILFINYARTIHWSIRAAEAREEVAARAARRLQRLEAQGEARRRLDAAEPSRGTPSIELLPPDASARAPAPRPQGKIIDRPQGGADTYEIDPNS